MMGKKEFKKDFKEKIELDCEYRRPIKWAVNVKMGNLTKEEQKGIVDHMMLIADSIQEQVEKKYNSILSDANNGYIRIEQIPNYEDIFGSIEDMKNSNLRAVEDKKKEIVKLNKKKAKINDYDKLREIESELFWAKHHMESYESQARFLDDMKGKIIRETKWKLDKKFAKEVEQE